MAILSVQIMLTIAKRGITSADIYQLTVWLTNKKTAAETITGATAEVSIPGIDDDLGTLQSSLTVHWGKTSFTEADITNLRAWVKNNVEDALPQNCVIRKNYSWSL